MSPTSRPRSSASRATCRLPKNPRASAWFSRTTPTCASSVTDWTIATLGREIAARQVSPVEVTRECLERVARLDGKIRSFITVDAEGALATARELEAELSAGLSRGPFHGIPLAYKDLCHVQDRKSTRLNSSHMSISYAVFCLKKKTKPIWTLKSLKQKKKTITNQKTNKDT